MSGFSASLVSRADIARQRYLVTPHAYLISVQVTALASAYINYLRNQVDPGGWLIFGQAPGIYIPFLAFPVTLILWLMCRQWATRSRWTVVFLFGLGISWVVHFALIQIHGDMSVHAVWLFVPVLILLLIKPPTWEAARQTLQALAWGIVGIALLTLLLERLGALQQSFPGGAEVIAWQEARYWLPLQDLLGVEGRWPGPFGSNQKTAFMAVISIIIGLTNTGWRRLILVLGGSFILVLTGSRGGFLALAIGVFILLAFSRWRTLERVPATYRLVIATLVFVGAALLLYNQGSLGLTGRLPLWTGFLNLWEASPFIGVGQTGISSAPAIVTWMDPTWMDAHSIYVQQLTRYGILGSLFAFGSLLVGLAATMLAAIRRWSLPLALIAAYLGAGFTEYLHDGWQLLSTQVVMVVVAVLGATSWNSVFSSSALKPELNPEESSVNDSYSQS